MDKTLVKLLKDSADNTLEWWDTWRPVIKEILLRYKVKVG